jgi:hypothetical protein
MPEMTRRRMLATAGTAVAAAFAAEFLPPMCAAPWNRRTLPQNGVKPW